MFESCAFFHFITLITVESSHIAEIFFVSTLLSLLKIAIIRADHAIVLPARTSALFTSTNFPKSYHHVLVSGATII